MPRTEEATTTLHMLDRSNTAGGRVAAMAEVLLAFAVAHVCWRAFKRFTWLGREEAAAHLNYSAGMVMILVSLLAIRLRGGSPARFGLTLGDWRANLNLGLFWGLVIPLSFWIVVRLSGSRTADPAHPGTPWGLAVPGSALAVLYALLLARMLRGTRWKMFTRVGPIVGIPLLLLLLALPVLMAIWRHHPPAPVALTVGWLTLGAGLGEETFFRGYIQTRLDLSFGTPISFQGMRMGIGLVISSLLFGLVHALNTVDYFGGQIHWNWPSGVFNCFVGVFYAVMRCKTGSIFPGVVAHALEDVLVRISSAN